MQRGGHQDIGATQQRVKILARFQVAKMYQMCVKIALYLRKNIGCIPELLPRNSELKVQVPLP